MITLHGHTIHENFPPQGCLHCIHTPKMAALIKMIYWIYFNINKAWQIFWCTYNTGVYTVLQMWNKNLLLYFLFHIQCYQQTIFLGINKLNTTDPATPCTCIPVDAFLVYQWWTRPSHMFHRHHMPAPGISQNVQKSRSCKNIFTTKYIQWHYRNENKENNMITVCVYVWRCNCITHTHTHTALKEIKS